MHTDELKTQEEYFNEKKPGDEGYWKGYLDASEALAWDLRHAIRSPTSAAQRERGCQKLLSKRREFHKNCADIITSEYEQFFKRRVVQTNTIEYNFDD